MVARAQFILGTINSRILRIRRDCIARYANSATEFAAGTIWDSGHWREFQAIRCEDRGREYCAGEPKRSVWAAATEANSGRDAQFPRGQRRRDPAATQNSFDYSSFIFVGITSLLAEGTDAHSQLGKGIAGFGRYYWRGFVDKTDGNYLVIFVLPTVFHQDERYYALGKGSIWKRGFYAASRIAITPDYHGHNSFNVSELLGRGMAQGISVAYYPSGSRTAEALATKYAYAIGRDALTNVFREFWPDIAEHVLHRHP
jgi:hypothetical protein